MEDREDLPVATGLTHGTVLVDIWDVCGYLSEHGVCTGIQRVALGVMRGLEELAIPWAPTLFDSQRDGFSLAPKGSVTQLLAAEQRGDDPQAIRSLASHVLQSVSTSPIAVTDGALLLLVGAPWIRDGFTNRLGRMCAEGLRVRAILYDLDPDLDPGRPDSGQEPFVMYVRFLIRWASHVCVPSLRTKERLRQWEDQLQLSHTESSQLRLPPGLCPIGIEQLPSPPRPRPFVLQVGTVDGRKNHRLSIQAWQLLGGLLPSEEVPDLVIVGRLGRGKASLNAALANLDPSARARIHLCGEIGDAALARLYRDSLFTLYLSRFEGWGLPVAESFRFGKAAIVTRDSGLDEVGGGAVEYVSQHDPSELATAVAGLLLDADLLRRRCERIAATYRAPTWAAVASDILV